MEKRPKNKAGFGNLVVLMMRRRWLISAMVLLTFLGIVTGILISIHAEAPIDSDWKEILLLLLGAFIGSFGKVIEYWFTEEPYLGRVFLCQNKLKINHFFLGYIKKMSYVSTVIECECLTKER